MDLTKHLYKCKTSVVEKNECIPEVKVDSSSPKKQ